MGDDMTIDEKAAFYFRHRTAIEEWAALRDVARQALIPAFWGLGDRLLASAGTDEVSLVEEESQWSRIGLRKPAWEDDGWDLSIILGWHSTWLLNPTTSTPWPYVAVHVGPEATAPAAQTRATRDRCLQTARSIGLTAPREDHFPVWGYVSPAPDVSEMRQFVDQCLGVFQTAWRSLHTVIDDLIRQPVSRGRR